MREKQEMSKTRQTFSKEFKATVVLEALWEAEADTSNTAGTS